MALIPPKVGEIPYHSKVTEQVEKLPVAVGLMSFPGRISQYCALFETD
jgi:hypothetical protein